MTLANQLQALGAVLGLVGTLIITLPSLSALRNQAQTIRASELEGGNTATKALIDTLKAGVAGDAKVVIARLARAHIAGLFVVSAGFFATLAGLLATG